MVVVLVALVVVAARIASLRKFAWACLRVSMLESVGSGEVVLVFAGDVRAEPISFLRSVGLLGRSGGDGSLFRKSERLGVCGEG